MDLIMLDNSKTNILSQLPIDIIIQIVTKYTKKFRVEHFSSKRINFIDLIDAERITDFEKLYKTIPVPYTIIYQGLDCNMTRVHVAIAGTENGGFCFTKFHNGFYKQKLRYYCDRTDFPSYLY